MERLVFSTRRLSLFQYRKRYGLHAISRPSSRGLRRFNTASGMDCMQLPRSSSYRRVCGAFQYRKRYGLHAIAKNVNNVLVVGLFQYRKRYGLHAILSPGSLGNSEPRSRFSDTDPLFALFPKVRGTFLSRKVLRKGLEASHSKGTFVHERNLILMAFSLDFRASLEQSIPRRMGACQQVSENFSSAVQAKIRRERFRRRSRWISFPWHGTPSFPGGALRFFGEIADK